MPKGVIAMLYGKCVFSFFFQKLPNSLPVGLYHFTFLPAMWEKSIFSTFLPALGVTTIIYSVILIDI